MLFSFAALKGTVNLTHATRPNGLDRSASWVIIDLIWFVRAEGAEGDEGGEEVWGLMLAEYSDDLYAIYAYI